MSPARKLQIIGQRFGKLVVKREAASETPQSRFWCVCDCGNLTTIVGARLVSGKTISCGCVHHENFVKYHNRMRRQTAIAMSVNRQMRARKKR